MNIALIALFRSTTAHGATFIDADYLLSAWKVFECCAYRNKNVGEDQHRMYKRLKLGGSQAYDPINCLDCGYILGQFMNSKHSVLYKTWTSGLRRLWLLKKIENANETSKNMHTYTSPTETRTVTSHKTYPSSRQGGCLTTNKIAALLTTNKIWSWIPEGLNAKTDGLTELQLQSNSDSDWMSFAK
jgi:hypothetical protein